MTQLRMYLVRLWAVPMLLPAVLACKNDDSGNNDGTAIDLPGDGVTLSTLSSLGGEIPPDVDTARQQELMNAGNVPAVQRLFDELSWRSFVALNWPHDAEGQPLEHLTSQGTALWESYIESYQVFKTDGGEPDPYGEPRQTLPPIGPSDLPSPTLGQGADAISGREHRLLHNQSATDGFTVLDEVNQAFSSPLWDQNGNVVHYEVLLNQPEYDYIKANSLYNLQGQVAFYEANGNAQFPAGQFGGASVGAIEIKLAWRILTDTDKVERYVRRNAFVVVEADGQPQWEEVEVGLVGMHISHKTESSPQWVWSTFEHVDNLQVNDFEAFGPNSADHPKTPSFNDPSCEYCPINVVPAPGADGKRRTQVSRVFPIPLATAAYNAEMRAALAAAGSPLQYYELINTQWPTDPSAPPAAITDFPQNITNKSGGKPTPVFLISSVMETYFQGGATGAASGSAGSVQLVVDGLPPMTVPNGNGGNTPLEYAEGFCHSVGDDCGDAGQQLVLSTESCMGCHSSAPIATSGSGADASDYTFGAQLSADFSWLLQQKAHPKAN